MSYDYQFRFITIGDTAVGKSCLLYQFTSQKFNPLHDITIGVECGSRIVTVHNRPVKIWINDTAGLERFKSITRSYYRDAAGALLVYDITRRETFYHLANWLKEVQEVAKHKMIITLVGSKCDLARKREVSTEEGQQFAKEHGLLFIEASAKTCLNVDQAFIMTATNILPNINLISKGVLDLTNNESSTRPQVQSASARFGGCCNIM
ncbi:hypothetical protein ACFE04_004724 [Oxalis oulophora]